MKKSLLLSILALSLTGMASAASFVFEESQWTWNNTTGTLDLGEAALTGLQDWTLSATISLNGTSGNNWGSTLLASGANPTADSFPNGFQFYMSNTNGLVTKGIPSSDSGGETTYGTTAFKTGLITIDMAYDSSAKSLTWTVYTQGDSTEEKLPYATATRTELNSFFQNGQITQLSSMLNKDNSSPSTIQSVSINIVPEPTTAVMGLLGIVVPAMRRRRRS